MEPYKYIYIGKPSHDLFCNIGFNLGFVGSKQNALVPDKDTNVCETLSSLYRVLPGATDV